jgi:hypothetical protein
VVQRANAAPCTTKVGSYMMKGRRLDVREGERRKVFFLEKQRKKANLIGIELLSIKSCLF